MQRFLLCAALVLIAISCPSAQTAQNVCADSALPEGVRAVLASQYADWRVETFADLDADYQKAWMAKRPNECPGIVAGHFEGKSDLSYALLLIPRAKGKPGYRLAALSKASSKGNYFAIILDQSDTYSMSDSAVFRADPGLQFDEEKFATFKLKSEAIYFETFEKGGSIYYWKHGRYEHVVESD